MPHTSQKLDPTQRAEYIIDCLLNDGYVQVKDLAIEMSVDESTVRRDLSELAEKGLLKRVYGGATHVLELTDHLRRFYNNRYTNNLEQKQHIGQEAAKHVVEGQVVAFSSGSTSLQIAIHVPKQLNFTAITNDLNIVRIFSAFPNIDVFVPGGYLRMDRETLVGEDAQASLRPFEIDLLFLTVTGVHPRNGVMAGHIWNVMFMRELVLRSKRRILVADSSKLQNPAQIAICGWDAIDLWITDAAVPQEVLKTVKGHGVSMIVT